MKRRNFIFTTVFSLVTYKTLAHSLMRMKKSAPNNFLITNAKETYVTLKGGSTYKLPENPSEIDSVIYFKVQKSKWSKSPIIDPSSQKIDEKSGSFDVESHINLDLSRKFTLQYISKEMGWILLS